jgi:hypothetical protein
VETRGHGSILPRTPELAAEHGGDGIAHIRTLRETAGTDCPRTRRRNCSGEEINFDTPANPPLSPGFFAGWATVAHTLVLLDSDHAISSGTNEFHRADGTLYTTGCSSAESVRFE